MTNIQYYKGIIDVTGCISNAWALIKPNYWLYFGISLLTYLLVMCIPCINIFLMGPVMGGLYYVSLKGMRGEPVDFGMMFKGFDKFVPLMVVGLIQSVPSIIYQFINVGFRFTDLGTEILGGFGSKSPDFYQLASNTEILAGGFTTIVIIAGVALAIFSILWAITFMFVVPIIMENDISIGEAIKLSARASWSNVGGIVGLAILGGLMMIVGFLVICIGMFFVLPVVWVSWIFAYRQVFPDLQPKKYFTEPPPPTEYGTFGQQFGS